MSSVVTALIQYSDALLVEALCLREDKLTSMVEDLCNERLATRLEEIAIEIMKEIDDNI